LVINVSDKLSQSIPGLAGSATDDYLSDLRTFLVICDFPTAIGRNQK
jgi:hypothetical protein